MSFPGNESVDDPQVSVGEVSEFLNKDRQAGKPEHVSAAESDRVNAQLSRDFVEKSAAEASALVAARKAVRKGPS